MFIQFSKSMRSLAEIFKIDKKERSLDVQGKVELLKKKNFKKNQARVGKMIFGVGAAHAEMKNKTSVFRIMPTKVLGFSKV